METTLTQSIKLMIVSATGLSKDALHIYAGLSVFIIAAFIHRKGLASLKPWLAVVAIACTAEILDLRDDLASLGYWRLAASLHDVLNTIFWPTVLMIISRSSALFARQDNANF